MATKESHFKKKYLAELKEKYSSKESIVTEVINLEAIMNLPKGTEHFLSDLHGEYDAFQHVLRNGSGNVRKKVEACFGEELQFHELEQFLHIVYYPEEGIDQALSEYQCESDMKAFYRVLLARTLKLLTYCGKKYTRSKVRKSLDAKFSYITEELLYSDQNDQDKTEYYEAIFETLYSLGKLRALIISMIYAVQQLVVDHLHIVGDIYDRGPAPQKIMDTLMAYHSADIQWGNHDVTWIGASCGSPLCVVNVLRIAARYDALDTAEEAYGISLRPLVSFAEKYYEANEAFYPKYNADRLRDLSKSEALQICQMHQALAIIQFKLEGQWILRNPSFQMERRLLLDKLSSDQQSVMIDGQCYPITGGCFQTVDPADPYTLTAEEEQVVALLVQGFQHSLALKRHMDFLMEKGSLYLRYNGNLLIHGCVPLNEDGSLKALTIDGVSRSGRELFDYFDKMLRVSYYQQECSNILAQDLIWYLWTGENSSLFGKQEMKTFERYFLTAKETHEEPKNPYYQLREEEATIEMILTEFGLDPKRGHIINGHTPIKEKKGENPIKAGGKLVVIDGGFARAYQKATGIAGYTLLFNSYGMELVRHHIPIRQSEAIQRGKDSIFSREALYQVSGRTSVRETNIGEALTQQKEDLLLLLEMYDEL